MNPIYEDINGNRYTITEQEDGTFLRTSIDANGAVLESYTYKNAEEMDYDLNNRLFEVDKLDDATIPMGLEDDGSFEEISESENPTITQNRIADNTPKSTTTNNFNKDKQVVYNDGTFNYTISQDESGNYVKQQIDQSGNPVAGGNMQVYTSNDELRKDIDQMYQLVQDPALKQQNNGPQITSRRRAPKFIQQVGQMLDPQGYFSGNKQSSNRGQSGTDKNAFRLNDQASQDTNLYKEYYTDELSNIDDQLGDIKDWKQKNKAQRKENRLQGKEARVNNRLNRQANLNLFLEEKGKATLPNKRVRNMNKSLKELDKNEKRIVKMQERKNKILDNLELENVKLNSQPEYQDGGNTKSWEKYTLGNIPGTEAYDINQANQPEQRKNLVGSYYDENDINRDAWGYEIASTKPDTVAPTSSNTTPPVVSSNYNPFKLGVYGNKLSENAVNRTTAFNLARMNQPDYVNPLIKPDLMSKRQLAQVDFTPANEQEMVARRKIAQNQRSTAGMMGNLQQLAANMTKAKSKIARTAQGQQAKYDAKWMAEKQMDANQMANAKRLREQQDKSDHAAKQQYMSDTMTQWEKGDRERAKLYNQELLTNNQKEYANQLSNEYKSVTDENGVVSIIHAPSGKIDAQKTQEINALGQIKSNKSTASTITSKKKGGRFNTVDINMSGLSKGRKKRRNRLF